MTFYAVTANLNRYQKPAGRERSVKVAASKGHVVAFQEAEDVAIRAMRSLSGWDRYIPGGLPSANPIMWRDSMFDLFDKPGWRRIYRNKPGVKDGPDRSCTWVPLQHVRDGRFVLLDAHMIHQAWTSHPERQPGWMSSIAVLGNTALMLHQRHDCPVLITGDFNRAGAINIPAILESEVASKATFGRLRYDRWFIVGAARGTRATPFDTPSDHHALRVTIDLKGKPVVTKPNAVQQYRAAVEKANQMPFPTAKQRPAAVRMKGEVVKALAKGPKK